MKELWQQRVPTRAPHICGGVQDRNIKTLPVATTQLGIKTQQAWNLPGWFNSSSNDLWCNQFPSCCDVWKVLKFAIEVRVFVESVALRLWQLPKLAGNMFTYRRDPHGHTYYFLALLWLGKFVLNSNTQLSPTFEPQLSQLRHPSSIEYVNAESCNAQAKSRLQI